MSHSRVPLEVLQIHSPCPANFDEMPGEGSTRFCSTCNKSVHDFSMLTRAQADSLLAKQPEHLCVRLTRDPATDAVITLDYAPVSPRRRRWPMWAAITTGLATTAAALGLYRRPAAPPPRMMGSIAPTALQTLGGARIPPPTTRPTTSLGDVATPPHPPAPPQPPRLLGEVSATTTHPSTNPTTKPTHPTPPPPPRTNDLPAIMGKVAAPSTRPATTPHPTTLGAPGMPPNP